MNVNDVKSKVIEGDKLEFIFKTQKELLDKYLVIEGKNGIGLGMVKSVPVNLHDKIGQYVIKDYAWRITEELGEAMNCLKNKPWKATHMQTDEVHFKEELIDAFHFFVELLLVAGVEDKDLVDYYHKKSEVNKFRQASNY